jgi:hypothetical protein
MPSGVNARLSLLLCFVACVMCFSILLQRSTVDAFEETMSISIGAVLMMLSHFDICNVILIGSAVRRQQT